MDARHCVSLPAGSLLFAEGEAGASAYLIEAGEVEIFLLRDGREVALARRGPGEIVGEMAVIDKGPRSASARAVADCALVPITADQIAHRIAQTDPILRMCLGVVIARYRESIARIGQGGPATAAAPAAPPEDFHAALGTLSLETELRRALARDEFELFFQPIVRLPSRRLAGFEALIRWRHPTRGLVPPGDFIPVAEAGGIIGGVTDWALAEVGRAFPAIMTAALANAGPVEPLFMTVNISGHDLGRTGFAEAVAQGLAAAGIAPESVKLEVTESVLMNNPDQAVAALAACRRLGLGVALDDFGTGYSSLSYLGTLPITTLKIDRSFVSSMADAPASRRIVAMILRLAEELEIPVVAEGVEDAGQARMLGDLGCGFGQGYLFGRPQPLAPTLALAREWRAAPPAATGAPDRRARRV